MHHLLFPVTLFLTSIITVTAYPAIGIDSSANESYPEIKARQVIPKIRPKPSTSGPGPFHGSQFQLLEQTGYAPAIDAMRLDVFQNTEEIRILPPGRSPESIWQTWHPILQRATLYTSFSSRF